GRTPPSNRELTGAPRSVPPEARRGARWRVHDAHPQRQNGIGQIVRHRVFPFRGVVFDVDPVFRNTEEWWLAKGHPPVAGPAVLSPVRRERRQRSTSSTSPSRTCCRANQASPCATRRSKPSSTAAPT